MSYLTLDSTNITAEHICCAISDKKCAQSYAAKKQWLSQSFAHDYVFSRLDERAKVFIEYGPAETAWQPIDADNYLALGCFWVSGKYKQQGHGKALLAQAIHAAKAQDKHGLVAIVGRKKFHFSSDTKWLLKQGFVEVDALESGFVLLAYAFDNNAPTPSFLKHLHTAKLPSQGCVVYYSNRCPFSEYHVQNSLVESCRNRQIELTVIKLESNEQAMLSPAPSSIFSLFYEGRFVTTDISACMDSRFDKIVLNMKS
ncbi:GNAT family N-acetyltransferase [Alginatibacterium sediminis]|nr:GNAT family N-acetyltransferase [Alginatibacterium sediminis]